MDDREPLRDEVPLRDEDPEEEESPPPTKSPSPPPTNPEKSRFRESIDRIPDDIVDEDELVLLRLELLLDVAEPVWPKTDPGSKTTTKNTKTAEKPIIRTIITSI